MIKVNELRIGNKLNAGVVCVTIQGIHQTTAPTVDTVRPWHVYVSDFIKSAHYYCIEPYNLEPIPLTEEWLINFKIFKTQEVKEFEFCCGFLLKIKTGGYRYGVVINHMFVDLATVKFVHQLQNLYFALTGEELQIKDQNS